MPGVNAKGNDSPARDERLPFDITEDAFRSAYFEAGRAVGHSGSLTFCRRFLREIAGKSPAAIFPLTSELLHVVETGKSVNSPMEADIAKHLAENFVCGHYGTWKFDATARCIGLIVKHAREHNREQRPANGDETSIAGDAPRKTWIDATIEQYDRDTAVKCPSCSHTFPNPIFKVVNHG